MYKNFQEKEKPIVSQGKDLCWPIHLIHEKFNNLLGFVLRKKAECRSKELKEGYLRIFKAPNPKQSLGFCAEWKRQRSPWAHCTSCLAGVRVSLLHQTHLEIGVRTSPAGNTLPDVVLGAWRIANPALDWYWHYFYLFDISREMPSRKLLTVCV